MNGIPVCKLCLEPISNFICPDCLYKSVQQWIWRSEPSLIRRFRDFHVRFIETLVSQKTSICVACKQEYYHMICPYDYLKEVYAWLEDSLPADKLREFLRIFSMGFKKTEINLESRFFYRNHGPAIQTWEKGDTGICELCENYSDDLKRDSSNRYVCEQCR
ncbi:MAG: hypothetical protein JXC85_06565 [Candidatus Aenigmarchaeota archaeon]|nr:hypothetical protein [Candidatus Aenigmarchaeota archaeon]